jgi:hypothetical protein
MAQHHNTAPAELTPERAALAAAIETWKARSAEIAAAQAAVTAADAVWRASRQTRVDAAAAIEPAKAATAEHAIAAAMGIAGEAPITIKAARAALTEAEDNEESAKAALDALTSRLAEITRYSFAEGNVKAAAAAVIAAAPETAALVAKVERLQRELVAAGDALLWLSGAGALNTARIEVTPYRTELPPAAIVATRLQSPPASWTDPLKEIPPGAGRGPWLAAMAALQTDAAAGLPK